MDTTTASPQLTKLADFSISRLQFLNEHYEVTQELPEFATPETLLHLYKVMTLVRALDNKAVNLQRQGKMGTYAAAKGQEAVGVGIGHALQQTDVFCTYYRDQAALIQRGVKPSDVLGYWGGDERASLFEGSPCQEDLPVCVPIAGQCLHATGIAYAIKYRKEKRAVATTIGEGGTSKGDFYEAMNLAGAWNLPLVFIVNNNQWAISVPRGAQTHTATIAQKAIAAGFEGLQVDGNDVIAVRYAVAQALEKARNGGGPTLIEATTYRLCDHTTADDASRYVPKEQLQEAWKKEPIARLGYYLEAQGLWSKEQEATLQEDVALQVEKAVEEYQNRPADPPTAMFDHLYATLPDALADQYEQVGGKA